MCSIVGGFVNNRTQDNQQARRDLESVFNASAERGADAFGYDTRDKTGRLLTSNREKMSVTNVNMVFPTSQFAFLGTMRGEPTTEWRGNTTRYDIQPFTVGGWTVCHNGTIANDQELRDECARTSSQQIPTQVDSWVIAYVLSRFGFAKGITRLRGSFAFLAFNDEEPEKIYYATNYKPLYLLGHPDGDYYFFASQAAYFDALPADPLHRPAPIPVQPYTHGWLDRRTGVLVGDTLLTYPEGPPKTLVICSGGLDSSVAAWMHHKMDFHVDLLHLQYECKAQREELGAVYALGAALKEDGNPGGDVALLKTDFFAQHASSSLTDTSVQITQGEAGAEFAHEWVPARNTVMIALAVAFAEKHGYQLLVLGSNQEESCGGYPDNEQEFINKWRALLPFAVKPYTVMDIQDPLGGHMKHDIVTTGAHWDAPMELSWSCYEGQYVGPLWAAKQPIDADLHLVDFSEGKIVHCGTCGPCTMRRRAFKMAGVEDRTVYAKEAL
jgi:7-cyano-7-deazaguanine synthase